MTRSQAMHVFLLEDDDEVAESLFHAFERRGWLLTRAQSLAEARALIAVPPAAYDVMVLDLNLPDGLGVDLLLEESLPGIPVAIYSGLPETAAQELNRRQIPSSSVSVFSKGGPFELLDWLKAQELPRRAGA